MPRVDMKADKNGVPQGKDYSKRAASRSSHKGCRGNTMVKSGHSIHIGQMRWIERGAGNTVLGRVERYLKRNEYLIAIDNDTYTIRKIKA
jgi:hypothetical protein